VQKEAVAVAVVATNMFKTILTKRHARLLTLLIGSSALPAFATVLPDERADAMYHRYEGGGVTVDGPSVLVRKNIAETVSISANYYVDHVSSASIDVVTQASPMGFQEDRTQKSLSVDYLGSGGWLYTVGYINSNEPDYIANTYTADVSQDFFGDLTNLSMGFSYGDDTVKKARDPNFKESSFRYQYRISISQIITPELLLALSWENIISDGYLHSPYRSDFFLSSLNQRIAEEDSYPKTHDSDAFALRALYYLPYRAALKAEAKHYTDDWGMKANSFELGYTHPLPKGLMLDLHARYYKQDKAYFYYDLLPYADAYEFHARDKALSTFNSRTLGFGVSYDFGSLLFPKESGSNFIDKASINFAWDRMQFNYEDFRDMRVTNVPAGTEPLYSFDANVIRLFLSVWY
jgi:hypothetical protein